MRVLALTTIFPNSETPGAAPYIRQQAVALSALCDLEVFALLQWLPGGPLLKRYTYWGKDFSRVPERELIDGLDVRHPRYLYLPRIGIPLAAASYAVSLLPRLVRRRREIDAIFATWAYPDGVAAIALGELLGVPVVVQVLGSDVQVVAALPSPRRQLRWALPSAAGVIAVSQPLADQMVELGARAERTHVIPTGLDLELFRPRDRTLARVLLGQPPEARFVLFVGRLYAAKGVGELLAAFERLAPELPDLRLCVVGDGPYRAECERLKARFADRVVVTGELAPARVADWLAAADVLALPSHAEGTPNVILEALGAGRKVVATRVGGIPAVIRNEAQGELVEPRDVAALAAALLRVLASPYDPEQVRASAELQDWHGNARRVLEVLGAARQSRPC